MDSRAIAFEAFQAGMKEEVRRNGRHRLDAQSTGIIDWTIEEAVEEVRTLAKLGHEDPEVLAWIDAFVDHHQDQVRYVTELYERDNDLDV